MPIHHRQGIACRRRAAAVLLPGLLLGAVVAGEAQEVAQPGPGGEETRPRVVPPVAEVFEARRATGEFLQAVGQLDSEPFLAARRERLQELGTRLTAIRAAVGSGTLGELTLEALQDLETAVGGELTGVSALAAELLDRTRRRDEQLDELRRGLAEWEERASAARERDAPVEVFRLVEQVRSELASIEVRLRADRDAALAMLAELADLEAAAAAFGAEIRRRRDTLSAEVKLSAGEPLWSAAARPAETVARHAAATVASLLVAMREHARAHWNGMLGWLLGCAAVTFLVLRTTAVSVDRFLPTGLAGGQVNAAFSRPVVAALLIGLVFLWWLGPPAPIGIRSTILALVPWPAAILATAGFARPLRRSAWTLAGAVSLLALQPFLAGTPLLSRYLMLTVAAVVVTVFLADLKRGDWHRSLPIVPVRVLAAAVAGTCTLIAASIVAEVFGLVGIADTLRRTVLGGLGLGLVFASLAYVIIGAGLALLDIPPVSRMPVVREQPRAVVQDLRKLVRVVVVLGWLGATLTLAGFDGALAAALERVLEAEWSLGAITIKVAAVVAGILVLLATWGINRVRRSLFETPPDATGKRGSGLSFAISKIVGYAITFLGVMFGLAVMGVDLTKVTVLLGALGVGIGLGLQGVVNNFVSGLILLFERPIQVHDITKVDEQVGTVRHVGIRATVIETFDGAEVIVPNADLITKTVLNWTRSNRRRRAEIDVGVAYGTQPGKVIEILQEIARAHAEVLQDPEPFAVFSGFGDSSLNFRLYLWLSDLGDILRVPSSMREKILRAFGEAGIEIPFPQRDVRITMAGGTEVPARAPAASG